MVPFPSGMASRTHFRAYARKELTLNAVLAHEDTTWKRDATVVNLGIGGACVRLEDPVTEGTPVTLRINAPTLWDPLQVHAVVAWCRLNTTADGSTLGLSFNHPSGRAVRHLVELLGLDPYG